MSRIVLSKYDNGEDRVVVGWDHPGNGAWWQEFNREKDDEGKAIWEYDDKWEEVLRYGGYMHGIPVDDFKDAVPEDIKSLITDEVTALIAAHSRNPESGRIPEIDMTEAGQEEARKAHDADIMEGIREGNMMDKGD
jgi:hypothetical protein